MVGVLVMLWLSIAIIVFYEFTYRWVYRRNTFNKIKALIENVLEAALWPIILVINVFGVIKERHHKDKQNGN